MQNAENNQGDPLDLAIEDIVYRIDNLIELYPFDDVMQRLHDLEDTIHNRVVDAILRRIKDDRHNG